LLSTDLEAVRKRPRDTGRNIVIVSVKT
jgi:hypothetical protein